MPNPIDDEVLLNRYVDGGLGKAEIAALEQRLGVDAGLRSRLASLISLHASIDIGLAGTSLGHELVTKGDPEATPTSGYKALTKWGGPSHWVARHTAGAAVAAVLCLLAVGVGSWAWLRTWRPSSPSSISPIHSSDPFQVLSELGGEVDKAAMSADLREILAPATSHMRRLDIYRKWRSPGAAALEPLVWSLAPFERDPRARAALFTVLPAESIRNHDSLLLAAQSEWSTSSLEPLSPLVDRLLPHPDKRSEDLFAEILNARPELSPAWFAERLPAMQAAFPKSPTICAGVTRALHDQDELVRAWAGLARAAIGQRDGVECARTLLLSSSVDVRILAITTINRHGTEIDLTHLQPLLNDADTSIRKAAREAFVRRNLPVPPSSSNP